MAMLCGTPTQARGREGLGEMTARALRSERLPSTVSFRRPLEASWEDEREGEREEEPRKRCWMPSPDS